MIICFLVIRFFILIELISLLLIFVWWSLLNWCCILVRFFLMMFRIFWLFERILKYLWILVSSFLCLLFNCFCFRFINWLRVICRIVLVCMGVKWYDLVILCFFWNSLKLLLLIVCFNIVVGYEIFINCVLVLIWVDEVWIVWIILLIFVNVNSRFLMVCFCFRVCVIRNLVCWWIIVSWWWMNFLSRVLNGSLCGLLFISVRKISEKEFCRGENWYSWLRMILGFVSCLRLMISCIGSCKLFLFLIFEIFLILLLLIRLVILSTIWLWYCW